MTVIFLLRGKDCVGMYYLEEGILSSFLFKTRDLPGKCSGSHFFHPWRFFRQTAANADEISFTKHCQKPSTSNSDCKLLIAPINLKPTPVTAALLEYFEEVPITNDFSISEAPNQTNHKTKNLHILTLVLIVNLRKIDKNRPIEPRL